MNTSKPFLSIIVCTYNRAPFLEKCLESLLKQRPVDSEVEIIIVDNNSNDSTGAIIGEYASRVKNLRYVLEIPQGLSYARNRGRCEANGEYLLYLDDDALAPPEYLMNLQGVIRTHSPDFIGGPVFPFYTSEKPWWFRDAYATRLYETKSGFSRTCSISGGNYIIRKAVLEKLGGFDSSYGMKGVHLGMLEERKVLELYRWVTPADQQKVYYAIECWVKHHTSPDKLSMRYILHRAFVAGRASFWMVLEVRGKADQLIGVKTLLMVIPTMIRDNFHQIRMQGMIKADYIKPLIDGLSAISRGCGILSSQLSYLFSKKSASGKK
jgi:glucosyl-dolichyl phosphate glucuronosyltransferase